jgi:hypothetical protein
MVINQMIHGQERGKACARDRAHDEHSTLGCGSHLKHNHWLEQRPAEGSSPLHVNAQAKVRRHGAESIWMEANGDLITSRTSSIVSSRPKAVDHRIEKRSFNGCVLR